MNIKKILALLSGPVLMLLIVLLSGGTKAGLTLGVAVWLITWWVTEATSLFVTAILPIVLFPLLNISTIEKTASAYGDPMIFLFMGGFLIALALEKTGLHRRFSLSILKYTGNSTDGLVLGFLLSTAFLSMWISNTATTMLMLPIATSVIALFEQQKATSKEDIKNLSISIMLCISYASSIGGMATLVGTPPNIVFAGFMEKNEHITISFSDWLLTGLPVAIVMLIVLYFLLVKVFFIVKSKKLYETLALDKLTTLSPKLSPKEKVTLIVFIITAMLWIFKDPINALFHLRLNDPSIAMIGGISLFIIPSSLSKEEYALQWKDTRDLPFGILFLFGGGIALANALSDAGLLNWIAEQVKIINFSKTELILILIVITVLLTEIMSNVALVIVFLPIVVALSKGLSIPPLMLAIPVTLAASSGFMLPMSTPPNAIAFSSGHIRIKDMIVIGLVLDIISVIVIFLAGYFLVPLIHSH